MNPVGLCVSQSAPAWQKIAFGVCSDNNKWWEDFKGGVSDMWNTYKEMRKANTKNSDKYFHCLANCRASNRGQVGKDAAIWISDFREWYQEPFDGAKACEEDQKANRHGRKGGDCARRCEIFKPIWLPSWVKQ